MSLKLLPGSADDSDRSSTGHGYLPFSNLYDWYGVRRRRIWRPPTDVYETDEAIVVKVEIAGMKEDDFEISFHDNVLSISGQRRDPGGKLIYQNMEIGYGEFRTEVRVDGPLDQSEIRATYEQGFLFVSLPKAKQYRVRVRTQDA